MIIRRAFAADISKGQPSRDNTTYPEPRSTAPRSGFGVKNIVFPRSGEVRVRRVISRSNAKATGKYPSWKMQRTLHWESVNELHAFRLLDCDPDVVSFSEQPCRIEYEAADGTHWHFPDILVTTRAGKELWEVKPAAQASRADVAHRTEVLINELPRFGYTYRLILAHELAKQPRLNNAGVLLRYGRNPVSELQRESVRRSIARTGVALWGDACSGRLSASGRAVVSRLVLEGVFTIDMASPIVPTTVLRVRRGEL